MKGFNNAHFNYFFIVIMDQHNHKTERNLRWVCCPMSPKRQEYIDSMTALNNAFFEKNPMPNPAEEKEDSEEKEDTEDQEQLVIEPAEKYICTNCSKVFQKPGVLGNHMAKKHGHKGAIIFRCPTCKNTFEEFKKLSRHMKIHT